MVDTIPAALRRIIIAASLAPLAWLAVAAPLSALGANPIEVMIHTTGDWSLRFLLMTLAVAPLRHLLRWPALLALRPAFGRLTFAYACLHVFAYAGLDQLFDLPAIARDLVERPFITLGAVAFVLMLPLAATSNRQSRQKLGSHWQRLHRLIYVVALAAVLHFWWLVKADTREPMIYAAVLALLLGQRLWVSLGARPKNPGAASPPPV